MEKITKDTLVSDVLNIGNTEKIVEVLREAGMHCFGCSLARHENLEDAAMSHGFDVDELVAKLNEAANS